MRLNQIIRGWSNYFKHAVAKHTMSSLENFVWHRVIRWWKKLHPLELARGPPTPHRTTCPVRAALGGRGRTVQPSPRSGSRVTDIVATRSPPPGWWPTTPDGRHREGPVALKQARRVRRAARGNGPIANRRASQEDSTSVADSTFEEVFHFTAGGIRLAMIAIGLGLALCGSGLGIGVEALASLDAELARIDIGLQ
jgi:hypothetical protein